MKRVMNWADGLPGGLFFLVLTTLMHARILPLLPIERKIFGMESYSELFHLVKAHALVLFVVIFFVLLIMSRLTGYALRVIPKAMGITILGYILLVSISYALSADKDLSWRGSLDHYEGYPVLISYALLVLLFYQMTTASRVKKWVEYFIPLNAFIVFVIGLSQMMGHNLLNHPWMIRLVTWPATFGSGEPIGSTFVEKAFGTLGNSNFMGSFTVLIIPILIGLFIASEGSRQYYYGIILVFGFTNMLGSNSSAGLVAFLLIMPLLSFYIARAPGSLSKHRMIIIMALLAGILTYILPVKVGHANYILFISALIPGILLQFYNWNHRIFTTILTKKNVTIALIFVSIATAVIGYMVLAGIQREKWIIQDMYFNETGDYELVLSDGTVTIHPDGDAVIITEKGSENRIVVRDGDTKTRITVGRDELVFTVTEDKKVAGIYALVLHRPHLILAFGNYKGVPVFTITGNGGLPVIIEKPERLSFFDGMEKIGNGRLYIWSRTIPMLRDRLLIGSGPDSFVKDFPQNDLLGKMALGNNYLIIDKPHNMYLQIAFNTGVLSLLALIVFIGHLMWIVWDRYMFSEKRSILILTMGASIFGYCITGLFNDSVVSVAPVFWAFTGILAALIADDAKQSPTHPRRAII